MPIDGIAVPGQRRWPLNYPALLNGGFAVFIFLGMVAIVEPSPYDFASFVVIPLWFVGGFKAHRVLIPFFILILLYNIGGFDSLIPYVDEHDPSLFMFQSLYLAVTALFFALFFAEDGERRADVCLKAYAASTVCAALCGIAGYFDLGGTGDLFSRYGRASGTFKDPNVLGSYLIMGGVYFTQSLVLARTARPLWTLSCLLVVVAAVFLSFSRGSWGAFAIALGVAVGLAVVTTADPRLRRRIALMSAAAVAVGLVVVAFLLLFDDTRTFFLQRAAFAQDYDQGETGRFGNQIRSLPMLLERLNGFGPLRFRLIFGLDPHNSYINAFASYGWLGGCAFFLLVGLTTFVGFRLALRPSPYRRVAQVFWPSLFVFLLQGFQIDIDHWRHVYLMLGAVWGLEAARVAWAEGRQGARPDRRATRQARHAVPVSPYAALASTRGAPGSRSA